MRRLKSIGFEIDGEGCSNPFQAIETLCFEDLQEWEQWNPVKENEHVEIFSCLRQLSIVKCPRVFGKLPDHLPLLEKIVISECTQLMVSLSSLPLFRKLEIDRCKGMVCSGPTDLRAINSLTLSNISEFGNWLRPGFQKADYLKFVGCEELMYLWQNEICLEKPLKGLHSLISLRKLSVEDCPSLTSFLQFCFLSILSELKIHNCNALASLPAGMKHNNACLKSLWVGGCHSLTSIVQGQLPSSLNILQIRNCRKLHCLLDDKEDTSVPSSSSCSIMHGENDNPSTSLLQYLYVYNCPSLMCLSSRGQLPKTLQHLEICDCPKLGSIAHRFHNDASLGFIWIWKCDNLKSIPKGLHNLISLHEIYIWDCPSLVSFPEGGLPNTSLRVTISKCEKLEALPSQMHSFKFLQELKLYQCPSIISFPKRRFSHQPNITFN